jgi:IS30 family transposase
MQRSFTPDNIHIIIELYKAGKQQREIAKQLNCSQTTISGILRRNKIQTRIVDILPKLKLWGFP